MLADLAQIYATPTGKKLLESLAKSGKTVDIMYNMKDNSMGDYDLPAARFFQPDGTTGAGTSSKIFYDPAKGDIGDEAEWQIRPPAIGLAHELIHSEQAAYGCMCIGRANNDGRMDKLNPSKHRQADVRELEAGGISPDYHLAVYNLKETVVKTVATGHATAHQALFFELNAEEYVEGFV